MKKLATKALAGALSLAMVCGVTLVAAPQTASAKVKVKKVTATSPSGKTLYVAKGKKVKISATVKVTPNKKANKKVTYKSANKKIATVSSKGVVKGVKAGKTKITIASKKDAKKKTTIKVVVKKAAVKKVTLNAKTVSLAVGGKKTLKAKVSPTKNVSNKVTWTTSSKKVATVTSKGVVKGVKEGTATITAKAADGSGKKATCKVTVGVGIASLSVPTEKVVRVTLSGAKALKASDFVVQTKTNPSAANYTTIPVEQVNTTDNKAYDVSLESAIGTGCYLKVTIGALASSKSMEIYVDNIAGYGTEGNETINYVYGYNKGERFTDYLYVNNSNVVGRITYTSITGLPSGLKAYISKDKTEARAVGVFNNVEDGTTAVVTGTDEKGTTFTQKYIFYIGSEDRLVAGVRPAAKQLSYTLDDPNTELDEEEGFDLSNSYNITNYVCASGGSGEYYYTIKCNGKDLDELIYDAQGKRIATPAGVYNFTVEIIDEYKANLKTTVPVSIELVDGVTVSGKVVDAAGQGVKGVSGYGNTKSDAYGNYNTMTVYVQKDGTYKTRVVPGDYYTYCLFDGNEYDITTGNNFAGNTVKNFVIPLYRVNFALNVPGAGCYSYSNIAVVDSYGMITGLKTNYGYTDGDFSLYAYLKVGNYDVYPVGTSKYQNTVNVYGNAMGDTSEGKTTYTRGEFMGEYQVTTGSFSVNGNSTVTLDGTKISDVEFDDYDD